MKKALLLGVIALLLGVSSETFAQGRNNRSDRQRVRGGVRSGQITRDEARVLRERGRQNRTERRGYRSDGTITRAERREIRSDERRHDRQIRRARRNNDGTSAYWRNDHHRGNGYYRRGAGSRTHPVFGTSNRRRGRRN